MTDPLSLFLYGGIIATIAGLGLFAIHRITSYKFREKDAPPKKEKPLPKREQKKIAAAKKEMEKVKEATKALPAPPAVPLVPAPGTTETQGEIKSLEEFPIDQKIDIEITRMVENTTQRITIAKGKVAIKAGTRVPKVAKLLFFVWQKGAQYFINPKKIIKVTSTVKGVSKVFYKLVFDVLYGEALNQDGSLTWDDDLEMILADSGLDQYVTIAAWEGGFQFSPTLVKAIIVVGVMGALLGLGLNGTQHFVPVTEIHWIP